MHFTDKLNMSLAILVISIGMYSCKTIIPEDGLVVPDPIVNTNIDTIPDSIKGLLVFHENFQKWTRD